MFRVSLPFFTDVQKEKGNSGNPELYPFDLYFDNTLKLYRQKVSPELDKLLKKVYLNGSMLNGEMNKTEGRFHADAALKFILSGNTELYQKKLLEIGCGSGYILSEMAKKGAVCFGIEPGPQVEKLHIPDIKIVRDFFPSKNIDGKFDIILHFNVIEHICDFENFLQEQLNMLNEGGRTLFGMPNCEPYLMNGDISIFAHEHCNYFTKESLIYLSKSLGVSINRLEEGAQGGMLFIEIVKEPITFVLPPIHSFSPELFESEILKFNSTIAEIIKVYPQKKVAIYCPLRAMNVLSMEHLTDVRLIDDKPSLRGKYLPHFSNPIENFQDLENTPPDCIFVFSRTFCDVIVKKCLESSKLCGTKIYTLKDINSVLKKETVIKFGLT